MIALLVGEIGAGKTTICRRVADVARQRGLRVGGILTRPLYDARGRKTGLVAEDLWSARSRLLATLQTEPSGERLERHLSELRRGPYSFHRAAFAWAGHAVRAALAQAPDLVILDEVGPLELAAGAGFALLLDPLCAAGCPTLLVVRRSCRPALEARLAALPLAFEVEAARRDALPEAIVNALCPVRSSGFCRPSPAWLRTSG